MPDEYKLGNDTLVLNGLGARFATMLRVEVYVAGLYLKERSHDPAAIIATDQARYLELDFVRGVTRKEMTDAWTEGFKKNAGSKRRAHERHDTLNAAMADLSKGSKLSPSYAPVLEHRWRSTESVRPSFPVPTLHRRSFRSGSAIHRTRK
jgi:hypothetical protein